MQAGRARTAATARGRADRHDGRRAGNRSARVVFGPDLDGGASQGRRRLRPADLACPRPFGRCQRALEIGAVNKVVDHEKLESAGLEFAEQILGKSPTAIRMLKYALNAADDGMVGQQLFAGEATRLAYGTAEAKEGRDAFLEKRKPNWSDTPWHF